MKPILITSYVNPDIDGLACAVAYAEFLNASGRSSIAGVIGEVHAEGQYVMDRFSIVPPRVFQNADDFDEVILVDTSDIKSLCDAIDPYKVTEIIDHRSVHEKDKFPNAVFQLELVGAAATLIAEKFVAAGIEMSKDSATLIYAAIASNTLNFQAAQTTDRDRKMFQYVKDLAELSDDVWRDIFKAKSDLAGGKLIKTLRGDLAEFSMSGKKVGIAQLEVIDGRKLVIERLGEITAILETIKTEQQFDFLFLNTIDLDEGVNFFIALDSTMQAILMKLFDTTFVGPVAQTRRLWMRKQIVPLLKAYLA